MRKRTVLYVIALGLPLTPLLGAVLVNELRKEEELGRLAEVEAPRTELLRVKSAVEAQPDGCFVFVSQVLATELAVADLRGHFSQVAEGVAWAEPGRFEASTSAGAPTEAPDVAVRLLKQWAIVPDGVRRVVVYRTVSAPTRWDPRCW